MSQIIFLDNPKPFDLTEITGHPVSRDALKLEFIGRVVSTSPLMLDVFDIREPRPEDPGRLCDALYPIPLADARLKHVISTLRFNQLIKATMTMGGNAEYPHQFFLSALSLNPPLDRSSMNCFNHTGLLLSYRAPAKSVEYVNVYNDGSILYADQIFNRFGTQKLSHDELADLLHAFAAIGFDTLPAAPISIEPQGDRDTLSLLCSRLQTVSVADQNARLAPLVPRLEQLKARAISQTYYLLLIRDRVKLDIGTWPFADVPLARLEHDFRSRVGSPPPSEAMLGPVPKDFLSRLPQTYTVIGSPPEPNPNRYFTDAGKLYSLTRNLCGAREPRCDMFRNLTAWEIPQALVLLSHFPEDPKSPSVGTMLATRFGVLWPDNLPVRLSNVPKEGVRVPQVDYKTSPLYFELWKTGSEKGGVNLIEGEYLYRGVRICQVDPQAPPVGCLNEGAVSTPRQ